MSISKQELVTTLEHYQLEMLYMNDLTGSLLKLFPEGRVGKEPILKFKEYYVYLEDHRWNGCKRGDYVYAPDGVEPTESFLYDGAYCPKTPGYWRGEERCVRGHGLICMYAHVHGISPEKAAVAVACKLGLPSDLEGLLQIPIRPSELFIETASALPFAELQPHPALAKLGLNKEHRSLSYRSADGRSHYAAMLFEHAGYRFTLPVSVWLTLGGRQVLQWDYPYSHHLLNLPGLKSRPGGKVLLVPDEHYWMNIYNNNSGLICDFVVSTWLCGFSGALARVDWAPLRGREVVILVEYSEAGYRKARRLYEALGAAGIRHVRFISNAPFREAGVTGPTSAYDAGALTKVLVEGCLNGNQMEFMEFLHEANTFFDAGFKVDLGLCALSLPDFLALPAADTKWVMPGLIRLKDRVMIFAKKGVGKTWLTTLLYLGIASGRSFPNLQATSGKGANVLVIDGEDSKFELESRIRSLAAGLELPLDSVADKIRMVSAAALGKAIYLDNEEVHIALDKDIDWADVIVLDNLNALLPESLQSNVESNIALNILLNKWALSGKAVIVVHHAARNGNSFGSSAKEFGMETVIKLIGNDHGEYTSFKAEFTTRWRSQIPDMTFTLVPDGEGLVVDIDGGDEDICPPALVPVSEARSEAVLKTVPSAPAQDGANNKVVPALNVGDGLSADERLVRDLHSQGLSLREIEKKTEEMESGGNGRKISKSTAGTILKRLKEMGAVPSSNRKTRS
ncbi:AAA family ATPase [Desulfovibrio sp. OttesenSCG-928-C14]|nr:AAA family ATPase [Desulfovibrio sp. OttesenSCG-928-C14]